MCLPARPSLRSRAADLIGVGLSLACLVHCLALPLLLLAAPALSAWLSLPESFHAVILLLAAPAAALALAEDRRHHRHCYPVAAAPIGLALLAAGLAAHEGWVGGLDPETGDRLFTTMGALALASAHIVNWRLRHAQG
ncbi:MerC family mercury resistance protein [Sphingopyxis sp. NFH-91]|uniref:MerC family mercury resistance protein n=1 Tax=Sphingopyxis sp. NFH-91 TaxID=2744457 RepID=UPI001F308249|nr:MerC family mercury resistance protein [Sphingopyxis sp. NFH-91]